MCIASDMAKSEPDVLVRDKLQQELLSRIAEHSNISEMLIFHGGTMLRHYIYDTYRYSEDLDFYLSGISRDELCDLLETIILDMSEIFVEENLQFVRYPEGADYIIFGENRESGWINFDILKEIPELDVETERLALLGRYSDINTSATIPCMSLLDVVASKYNCLGNRVEPRDVYDFFRLSDSENIVYDAWTKYCSTWQYRRHPLRPEETLKAFPGWKSAHKNLWDEESSKLQFPSDPGFDVAYGLVLQVFESLSPNM